MKKDTNTNDCSNKESHKDLLKTIGLFSEFTDYDMSDLLTNVSVKHYKKGKVLFFVEDKAKHFYIVVNGWVKLFRQTRDGNESVLALLNEGSSFGKAAVLADGPYPYSAEVSDNATLLLVPTSFFKTMMDDNNKFNNLLTKLMESKLHDMNQLGLQSEHMALMTSSQRVGCFLLRLCRKQYEGSIDIQLPYEKNLVASRLGMKPETFSRSLNQLKEVGIKTSSSKVTIKDIRKLHAYVCDHCSATCDECPMVDLSSF